MTFSTCENMLSMQTKMKSVVAQTVLSCKSWVKTTHASLQYTYSVLRDICFRTCLNMFTSWTLLCSNK